jgi:uncharacterized protein (DUF58 family)
MWRRLAHEPAGMIRPRPRAIAVAATAVAVCLLCEALGTPGGLGPASAWAILMGVALANVADLALALRLRVPAPTRTLPERLVAGLAQPVPVTLVNPYRFSLRMDFNERPMPLGTASMTLYGLPRSLKVPARHQASFEYSLRPGTRGTLALADCELSLSGPLGLWQARRTFALPQRALAGPDFAALEYLALQGQAWRSPAPYQDSSPEHRNLPLTLLVWLDTGPGLQAGTVGGRLWDHATDAALALAFAAIGKGRPMGLHLNAGAGNRQLLPTASERLLPELYRLLGAVQPGGQQVDFAAEVARLSERPGSANLIILITRLPAHAGELQRPLSLLDRRHRLLIVDVLDEALIEAQRKPVRTEPDALGYCRALQALSAHEQAAYSLTRAGLNVVQTPGNTLANVVVDYYTRAWQ